jgi:hypothetical protein
VPQPTAPLTLLTATRAINSNLQEIYFGKNKEANVLYSDSILSYGWVIWKMDYNS